MITTVLIITACVIGAGAWLKWATMPVSIAFKTGRETEQILGRIRARRHAPR